nr:hypothetical protein [Marinicella sp. W31]MDC2879836.1 hypothetical protein [Marinicella sp. W31]
MGLTTEEQILIEQRVTNGAKSAAAAYLLWFLSAGPAHTGFISEGLDRRSPCCC